MSQRKENEGGSAKATPAGSASREGVIPHHPSLLAKIESATVRVGIIGLGYVGLPLARAFAERGIAVLGFDVDSAKIAKLERGQSYIGHIPDAMIRQMREHGFEATQAFERLDEPDA